MPLCQLFMMSLYIKSETTSTHMSHICLIYVSYRLLLCFLCSFRLSLPCWYCQRWHCRIGSIFVPRSSGTCASPSWRPCINALIRNHVNPRESKGTSTDSNWSKTKSYWQIFTTYKRKNDATQTHLWPRSPRFEDLHSDASQAHLLLLSSALHLDGAWHTACYSAMVMTSSSSSFIAFRCF